MASVVAATNIRVKRNASAASYAPGFYRTLNGLSSADFLQESPTSTSSGLRLFSTDDLPADCYLVERLIAERKQKVCFNNTKFE